MRECSTKRIASSSPKRTVSCSSAVSATVTSTPARRSIVCTCVPDNVYENDRRQSHRRGAASRRAILRRLHHGRLARRRGGARGERSPAARAARAHGRRDRSPRPWHLRRLLVECERESSRSRGLRRAGAAESSAADPGRRRARVRSDGGTRRIGRELPAEAVDELPVDGRSPESGARRRDARRRMPQLQLDVLPPPCEHHGGLGHVRGPRRT